MKTQLFTITILLFSVMTMLKGENSRILFEEDFEDATVGSDLLGIVQVKNFNAGGGADWTYDLATGSQAISGSKSAHLTINNAGNQWWGLQFKIENGLYTSVGRGLKYKVSFKIKSSTANNRFQFRIEATGNYGEDINITNPDVVQEVVLMSTPQDGTGLANFLWAFGLTPNPGEIWIDDIVVEELYTPLDYSENFNNVTPLGNMIGDFSLGNYEGGQWTYGVEQLGNDPNNKSLWLDITSNSHDWWVMQFKVEKFPVIKGKRYIIKFKAKSGLSNLFNFRVEGVSDYMTMLTTKGGSSEFEEYVCETYPMARSGVANFLWAFGRPTKPDRIYLDDITIQEKPEYPVGTEFSYLNLHTVLSDIHMSPAFNPNVKSYNILVPFTKENFAFTPTTDASGKIFIDDQEVVGGNTIQLPLAVGNNYLAIKVQNTLSNAVVNYRFTIKRKSNPAEAYQEKFRPQIHYSPEQNWCNDPNGLVFYDGEYHLFYQHNPHSKWWGPYNPYINRWQPMYWGHAISTDLVHWEEYPMALYPDSYGSMWSGSAVVDEHNTTGLFSEIAEKKGLVALYSSAANGTAQSMAYSVDKGRTWLKYNNGQPVLPQSQDPANQPGNFRDPKVFWHVNSNKWMMVVAGGPLRIFSSPNLIDWTVESSYHQDFTIEGKTIKTIDTECPDFFRLPVENTEESKWVLTGGGRFYMIGDFKEVGGKWYFIPDDNDARPAMNFGPDFYATQSYNNEPAGRRIITSWMSQGNYFADLANITDPYNGTYTLNCELKLKKDSQGKIYLYQNPINEYQVLRGIPRQISDLRLEPGGTNPLDYLNRSLYEIDAEFTPETTTKRVGFKLRVGSMQETLVYYDFEQKAIYIDRSASGIKPNSNFLGLYSQQLDPEENGKIKMRIFVDWSSVEVFVNEGKAVGSAYVFPEPESNKASVFAEGGAAIVNMNVYPLKRIWYDSGEVLDDSIITSELMPKRNSGINICSEDGMLTLTNKNEESVMIKLISTKGEIFRGIQLNPNHSYDFKIIEHGVYLIQTIKPGQVTVQKIII